MKKTTIDINDNNYEMIKEQKKKSGYRITDTVNAALATTIDATYRMKDALAATCIEIVIRCNRDMTTASRFEKDELYRTIEKAKQMYELLMYKPMPADALKNYGLVRYDISDGYIIVPDEWLFINADKMKSEEYKYPFILEFRNDQRYGIPHFVYLHDSDIMSKDDCERALNKAVKVFPKLSDILKLRVEPIYKDSKKIEMLNRDEWLTAPTPGFFLMYDSDEANAKSLYGEEWHRFRG